MGLFPDAWLSSFLSLIYRVDHSEMSILSCNDGYSLVATEYILLGNKQVMVFYDCISKQNF